MEGISLAKMVESFLNNFDEGQCDIERFNPLFYKVADKLNCLKIEYAFVDVSRKRGVIDFNLYLEEGIFLSVAKEIDEPSDDVMFTIVRNYKTIAIGEMPLDDLITKVKSIITKLKSRDKE